MMLKNYPKYFLDSLFNRIKIGNLLVSVKVAIRPQSKHSYCNPVGAQ